MGRKQSFGQNAIVQVADSMSFMYAMIGCVRKKRQIHLAGVAAAARREIITSETVQERVRM
jgi:hypothetical protein